MSKTARSITARQLHEGHPQIHSTCARNRAKEILILMHLITTRRLTFLFHEILSAKFMRKCRVSKCSV